MNKNIIVFFLILIGSLFANNKYITGEDGVIRIYVNVIGHVNQPGSYLVPDGSDLITIISLAGGPARGANLKKIKISNGEVKIVNFEDLINNDLKTSININPNTTVFIEETLSSRIFRGTNLISTLIQLLNIAITLERTAD